RKSTLSVTAYAAVLPSARIAVGRCRSISSDKHGLSFITNGIHSSPSGLAERPRHFLQHSRVAFVRKILSWCLPRSPKSKAQERTGATNPWTAHLMLVLCGTLTDDHADVPRARRSASDEPDARDRTALRPHCPERNPMAGERPPSFAVGEAPQVECWASPIPQGCMSTLR